MLPRGCDLFCSSIRKLEEKLSRRNDNAITRICQEAAREIKSDKIQGAKTFAMAADLFCDDCEKEREKNEMMVLQGE